MKISEAFAAIKGTDNTISSNKAHMVEQSPETLLYWLFSNNTSEGERISTLVDILRADDWKIDKKKRKKK